MTCLIWLPFLNRPASAISDPVEVTLFPLTWRTAAVELLAVPGREAPFVEVDVVTGVKVVATDDERGTLPPVVVVVVVEDGWRGAVVAPETDWPDVDDLPDADDFDCSFDEDLDEVELISGTSTIISDDGGLSYLRN